MTKTPTTFLLSSVLRAIVALGLLVLSFTEPCENPENFEDYDICGGISPEMCDDPEYVDMFAEFCPTLCSSCSKLFESCALEIPKMFIFIRISLFIPS